MNICFRVDSSALIGTGHVMRCLALAIALRNRGSEVSFFCRVLPGNIINVIEGMSFKVFKLPDFTNKLNRVEYKEKYHQWMINEKRISVKETEKFLLRMQKEIDWFVIDHYALDKELESFIKPYVGNVMVIDDLANRKHDCDLLLDQNLYMNLETRYQNLVSENTYQMLGPKYVLLRDEFLNARKNVTIRKLPIQNILVFFGGADATNETAKALEAIKMLDAECFKAKIILGTSNNNFETVQKRCENNSNIKIFQSINNMSKMIGWADLCIGGGGTHTWERCCLGLPSLTVAIVEHQIEVARILDNMLISKYLGFYKSITHKRIVSEIKELAKSQKQFSEMSSRSMALVDGKGCERVVEKLFKNISI